MISLLNALGTLIMWFYRNTRCTTPYHFIDQTPTTSSVYPIPNLLPEIPSNYEPATPTFKESFNSALTINPVDTPVLILSLVTSIRL